MDDVKQIVAANLSRLAARPGYSKSGLAQYLGVAQPMVSTWVSARRLPSSKYLGKIAEYFGVHVSALFAEDDAPKPAPPPPREITREEAWNRLLKDEGLKAAKIRKPGKNG